MSFWASSYSFQLEPIDSVALVQRGPVRVKFYDDCKDTRARFPGLLLSNESFDAMLGRVQTHRTEARNCSMKARGVQGQ
jgi:hypothetical protein